MLITDYDYITTTSIDGIDSSCPYKLAIFDQNQHTKGYMRPFSGNTSPLEDTPRLATLLSSDSLRLDTTDVYHSCIRHMKDHPFKTIDVFEDAFYSDTSEGKKLDLNGVKHFGLAKFMMSITIARPDSILSGHSGDTHEPQANGSPDDPILAWVLRRDDAWYIPHVDKQAEKRIN